VLTDPSQRPAGLVETSSLLDVLAAKAIPKGHALTSEQVIEPATVDAELLDDFRDRVAPLVGRYPLGDLLRLEAALDWGMTDRAGWRLGGLLPALASDQALDVLLTEAAEGIWRA
jgi:hypothetical protein